MVGSTYCVRVSKCFRCSFRRAGSYLGDDLQLLALADVLRLGHGGLELFQDPVIERLVQLLAARNP